MSFLDMFLDNPADPAERAQAVATIEEIRANTSPCDCDRADPRDPHEYWCPAVQETFCTGCGVDHDPHECGYNPDPAA